jgi:hypothetical protein
VQFLRKYDAFYRCLCTVDIQSEIPIDGRDRRKDLLSLLQGFDHDKPIVLQAIYLPCGYPFAPFGKSEVQTGGEYRRDDSRRLWAYRDTNCLVPVAGTH